MIRPRRILPVLLLAVGMVAACGTTDATHTDSSAESPTEADESGTPESTPASELLEALSDQADYEFEASVFVLEDGMVDEAGPTDRRYSFDSITKTMTGLLLAHLHTTGDLDLTTPIGDVLNAGDNADITMLELATHTSGLPEAADNWDQWEGFTDEQPYAGYTAEMAETALQTAELEEPIYSNFAFQLLGVCIEDAAGESLGDLADTLIFQPAEMETADIPEGERGLPDGLLDGEAVPAWDNLLTGDGGAGGTISDLAAYAAFMVDPPDDAAAAVNLATANHLEENDGSGTGLDWTIESNGLRWHAGASDAYNSLLVIDQESQRAVGYLTATGDLDDAAIDLLLEYLTP